MKVMVSFWLRMRTVHTVAALNNGINDLAQRARSIQRAARNVVQEEMPETLVPIGAIAVADVMMAGFACAAEVYNHVLEWAHDSVEEKRDKTVPDLDWGVKVAMLFTWAKKVRSPAKKQKKRPQREDRRKGAGGRGVGANLQADSSTDPARPFFAVAHGREPGVYRTRAQVLAQTQGLGLDGSFKGRMKICETEAEAKAYVAKYGKVIASPRRAGASDAAASGGRGGQSEGPGLTGACFAAIETFAFKSVVEVLRGN